MWRCNRRSRVRVLESAANFSRQMTELKSGGEFVFLYAQLGLLVVGFSTDPAKVDRKKYSEKWSISGWLHGEPFVRHAKITRAWWSQFYRLTQPTAGVAAGRMSYIWRVRDQVDKYQMCAVTVAKRRAGTHDAPEHAGVGCTRSSTVKNPHSKTRSIKVYWIKATFHYTLPNNIPMPCRTMPVPCFYCHRFSLSSSFLSFQQCNPTPHAIIFHTTQVPSRNA